MIPTITKLKPEQIASAVTTQIAVVHSKGHPHGPTHEQIAQCAYDIYIAHGRVVGRSELDWRQAEEELAQTAQAAANKIAVDRGA